MPIEAVVLTGGASSRMGKDKASLPIGGSAQAQRIADLLAATGHRVTVLGRSPLIGHSFLADSEEFHGPLAALSRYQPFTSFVFVVSCDIPLFDPRIVPILRIGIDTGEERPLFDAAMPIVGERVQPLCGLYRAEAFARISSVLESGKKSLMAWLDLLKVRAYDPTELQLEGLDPRCVIGANTPEEFNALIESRLTD